MSYIWKRKAVLHVYQHSQMVLWLYSAVYKASWCVVLKRGFTACDRPAGLRLGEYMRMDNTFQNSWNKPPTKPSDQVLDGKSFDSKPPPSPHFAAWWKMRKYARNNQYYVNVWRKLWLVLLVLCLLLFVSEYFHIQKKVTRSTYTEVKISK